MRLLFSDGAGGDCFVDKCSGPGVCIEQELFAWSVRGDQRMHADFFRWTAVVCSRLLQLAWGAGIRGRYTSKEGVVLFCLFYELQPRFKMFATNRLALFC